MIESCNGITGESISPLSLSLSSPVTLALEKFLYPKFYDEIETIFSSRCKEEEEENKDDEKERRKKERKREQREPRSNRNCTILSLVFNFPSGGGGGGRLA